MYALESTLSFIIPMHTTLATDAISRFRAVDFFIWFFICYGYLKNSKIFVQYVTYIKMITVIPRLARFLIARICTTRIFEPA